MRSFSELLREYTARTGISDTELARALGVRRQTIFRWKEGLVEKPRSREDVLRCAAKLRLSPEERDELLLSAGFAPESPRLGAVGAVGAVGAEAEAEAVPEDGPPPATLPTITAPDQIRVRAARGFRIGGRSVLLGLGSLLLGLLLVAGWMSGGDLHLSGSGDAVVPAADGETLIIVGASPDPAGRAVSARIKAAVDREAQAGRVGRLRTAIWPEEIRDVSAATTAVRRSRAAMVVSIAARTDDRLDSSILASGTGGAVTPLVRMRIRPASTEDTQTVALLVLAEVHAERGDVGLAVALLLRAQESPLADADSEAAVAAYFDQLSRRP